MDLNSAWVEEGLIEEEVYDEEEEDDDDHVAVSTAGVHPVRVHELDRCLTHGLHRTIHLEEI